MGMLKIHPHLSRKKTKLTKRHLAEEVAYKKLMEKWQKVPKLAFQEHKKEVKVRVPEEFDFTPVAKKSKLDAGSTALKKTGVYTGDKMLGIAQMAKSNAVPVFKKEEVVEIARMRR